jgi:bifunctional non-homologous end joining protein LigD
MSTVTITKTIESISLGYREGSSDKVYHASIEESPTGIGYVVNFSYGRRGGTLNAGTKTAESVGITAAFKIYNKLVDDKKAKGYTEISGTAPRIIMGSTMPKPHHIAVGTATSPTASPTPTAPTPAAPRVLPQLLNPVEEKELYKLFANPEFVMQPKLDGKRILLHRDSRGGYATNRKGLECGIPENIVEQINSSHTWDFIIDGELIGDKFHAFDILLSEGVNCRSWVYGMRQEELVKVLGILCENSGGKSDIHEVKTWETTLEKSTQFMRYRAANEEGVVFKRKGTPYTPGRPASGGDHLKFKFVATASVIVLGHNPDKRSVRMGLYGEDPTDPTEIPVGNVTIGGAIPIPPVGSVIEVRYLYAFKGGSLFQPIYLGERDDIDPRDCSIDQLKYKQEAE